MRVIKFKLTQIPSGSYFDNKNVVTTFFDSQGKCWNFYNVFTLFLLPLDDRGQRSYTYSVLIWEIVNLARFEDNTFLKTYVIVRDPQY